MVEWKEQSMPSSPRVGHGEDRQSAGPAINKQKDTEDAGADNPFGVIITIFCYLLKSPPAQCSLSRGGEEGWMGALEKAAILIM